MHVRYNLELLKIPGNPVIRNSNDPFLTYLNSAENIRYDFTENVSFELKKGLMKKRHFYTMEELFDGKKKF